MKLNVTTLLLTLLIPIGLSGPAVAGHHEKEAASDPLAAAAEFPLLLRRTTLIVRDIEASLKLYRDGLGMEVIYDQEINRPHSSEADGLVVRDVVVHACALNDVLRQSANPPNNTFSD